MKKGIIIKGYSSFYYVMTDEDNLLYECSLRGRHKLKKVDFLPGDKVYIEEISNLKGTIEKVLPRDNEMIRPPVANITLMVIVVSLQFPKPERVLLDRMLILAEKAGIRPIICLTKSDIGDLETGEEITESYIGTGYKFIYTSTKTGEGIEELKKQLKGEITVFAGQSGAGKSSLMNSLVPDLSLKTGSLGEKSRRGRHTTRHVELFPFAGGYLVDSPGFSRLYLPEIKKEELQLYFPEFKPYLGMCRFNSCIHNKEPDCAVKEALEDGKISEERYKNYILFIEEIMEKERRY